MKRISLLDLIPAAAACDEAEQWLRKQQARGLTPQQAWDACNRGDWMLWLLGWSGVDRRLLVRAAALCAEPAAALADEWTEGVCLFVVQTVVAWSYGKATDEDLRSAALDAADAETEAASAWAAWSAAWAADEAPDAADAAAWAADAVAPARAAPTRAAAARKRSLRHSAEIVRGVFPRAPAGAGRRR